MADSHEPQNDDPWADFKPIGDRRGDYRPLSLLSNILIYLSLLLFCLIAGVWILGRPLIRILGLLLQPGHPRLMIWGLVVALGFVLLYAIALWFQYVIEEIRTRPGNQRGKRKK